MKFYDGNSYVPSILNKDAVPHGLTVNYEVYNDKGTRVYDNSAAGVYTMKAIFTGGDINHNEIKPMEATLTVAKRLFISKILLILVV